MEPSEPKPPNPKRVAAGQRNRKLWRGLTDAGRERLRASTLSNRPWENATGPRTAEGKARSAANGRRFQTGTHSRRERQRRRRRQLAIIAAARELRLRVEHQILAAPPLPLIDPSTSLSSN